MQEEISNKVFKFSNDQIYLWIEQVSSIMIKAKDKNYDDQVEIDAFKYLPEDVALKALKIYLKSSEQNLEKLENNSKKLKKPLNKILKVNIDKNIAIVEED